MQLYCINKLKDNTAMQAINIKFFILLLFTIGLLTSCGDDDEPPMMQMEEEEEEEEEEINQVELTFTPNNGESPFTAIWFDADGEGVGELSLIHISEPTRPY